MTETKIVISCIKMCDVLICLNTLCPFLYVLIRANVYTFSYTKYKMHYVIGIMAIMSVEH